MPTETTPAPGEKTAHNKIVVRLYVPKNYNELDWEAEVKFQRLKGIMEAAPKEWWDFSMPGERAKGDPENVIAVFGGMRIYEIESAWSGVERLLMYPAYHLRR